MDNGKTGAFIKALRTEKGLTQRELAERLHLTDRAVSKWERGLNAPDIALLEPLADILEVSVVELIRGERIPRTEHIPAVDEHTRDVLAYSGREVRRRVGAARKAALFFCACFLAVLAVFTVFWAWRTGYFFVLDRQPSPDGTCQATVYGRELAERGFSQKDGVSVILSDTAGVQCRYTYPNCSYQGLWWSPDGKAYVLALNCEGAARLYQGGAAGCETNLSCFLDLAVMQSPLADYDPPASHDRDWVRLYQIDYQFIQWDPKVDAKNRTIQVYYSFTGEQDGLEHQGYFWLDKNTLSLYGLFELDRERTPPVLPIPGMAA